MYLSIYVLHVKFPAVGFCLFLAREALVWDHRRGRFILHEVFAYANGTRTELRDFGDDMKSEKIGPLALGKVRSWMARLSGIYYQVMTCIR